MDRERLTRLIQDPGSVDRADLQELKALALRYPWFSGAQLLRASGEHAAGDVGYDETLRHSAAHLPSRAVLFDLVAVHQEPTAVILPAVPLRVVREEISRAPVEPPMPVIEVAPINEAEQDEKRTVEEVVETAVVEAPIASPPDPLERQILEAALASVYDLSLLAPQEDEPPKVLPVPAHVLPELTSPVVVPTELPAAAPVERAGKMRFTAWLEEEVSVPPTSAPRQSPPAPSTTPAGPNPLVAATPMVDTAALIDRFIRQETPEPKKKTEFFTPQQAGKRSLEDSAGMVTETLARIYAQQGNLPKAREAYKRLALKYPEKSAYFAALAKSLEEPLNP